MLGGFDGPKQSIKFIQRFFNLVCAVEAGFATTSSINPASRYTRSRWRYMCPNCGFTRENE